VGPQERAVDEPAHHVAGAAPLRLQGPDPRAALPRGDLGGVREEVRARQGGAALPRRPDRGGHAGRLLRRRGGLPDQPRPVRPAGDQPGGRRGGGDRPGRQGVGARPARRGRHRRRAQAHRQRRAARPLGPRPRGAAHRGRGAGVRRVLGGHPGALGGGVRLPPARRRRGDPPAPAAVGRRAVLRALVRR
ncbi:MAG: FIG005453: Putative DeoR-family transcriptional regulator, partial [uncultured Nocardioides sp.]